MFKPAATFALILSAVTGLAQVSGIRNLGLEMGGSFPKIVGKSLIFFVSEEGQGQDLNEDGDINGYMPFVYDLEKGVAQSLGLLVSSPYWLGLAENWIVFSPSEWLAQHDLNNDGDTTDHVLHAHNLETGRTHNLEIAYAGVLSRNRFVFSQPESFVTRDLNLDGDLDDVVPQVLDLESMESTNVGLAVDRFSGVAMAVAGKRFAFLASETDQDQDLDGDGDKNDYVLHAYDLEASQLTNLRLACRYVDQQGLTESLAAFVVDEEAQNGDVNGDGRLSPSLFCIHDFQTSGSHFFDYGSLLAIADGVVAFGVSERHAGPMDLNVDGDAEDYSIVHIYDSRAGKLTNLGLESRSVRINGRWVILWVDEMAQGRDLDGDGEQDDVVVHLHDLETGERTNLEVPSEEPSGYVGRMIDGPWLMFSKREGPPNSPLAEHSSLTVHNLDTGETFQTGIPFPWMRSCCPCPAHALSGTLVISETQERHFGEGEDFNGNGVPGDSDRTVRLVDFETEASRFLPFPASVYKIDDSLTGGWLAVAASEWPGVDLNGDGDSEDSSVLHLVNLEVFMKRVPFHRGDPNSSGATDISDGIAIFGYLFLGDETPSCLDSADVNNSGGVDISDGIALLNWLFLGGPAPGLPGPPPLPCGLDPGPLASPGCNDYAPCR